MKKYSIILLSVLLLLLMLVGCAPDAQDDTLSDNGVIERDETDVVEEVPVIVSTFTEEDIASAENFGKAYIEAWKNEEWCISFKFFESKYNPELTEYYATKYIDYEPGWTPEYMAENFIVVTVKYECKLDHDLIFYPDGKCYIDLFVTRENADAPWENNDSTGIHELT